MQNETMQSIDMWKSYPATAIAFKNTQKNRADRAGLLCWPVKYVWRGSNLM